MQPREPVCSDDLSDLILKHHDLAVVKNNQRWWFTRAFFDLPIFASIRCIQSFVGDLATSASQKHVLNDDEWYSLFSIIADDRVREDESIEAFYAEVCELYGISNSIKLNSEFSKQKLFMRLLRMLASTRLLDKNNFDVVLNIINGHSTEWILNCYAVIWLLYKDGLLTQERFNKVANLPTAQLIGCSYGIRNLHKLRQVKLVDISNLGHIRFASIPFGRFGVIYAPAVLLPLTPIIGMSPIIGLATALVAMSVIGALLIFATIGVVGIICFAITKYRDISYPLDRVTDNILNCKNSKEYMSGYILLKNRRQDHLVLLEKSSSPYGMARFINLLADINKLGDANYSKLNATLQRNVNLTNLYFLLTVIFKDKLKAVFTQKLFDELMEFAEILSDDLIRNALMQIPAGLVKFDDFRACINLCRFDANNRARGQSLKTVDAVVKRLEKLAGQDNLIIRPSGTQSIHASSVEQAVAKSAIKLQGLYRDTLEVNIKNLDKVRDEISQAIRAWALRMHIRQEDQQLIDAFAALNRLLSPGHTYINDKSGISTYQLIGYLWCAVNDEGHYLTPELNFDEALGFFVQGLVETEHGNDNSGGSNKACASGSFNYLILPAKNYSKDVELNIVTNEIVVAALRINTAKKLEDYLLKMFLESKNDDEKKNRFADICAELKDKDCVSLPQALWDEIKPAVKQEMLKYKAFFADDKPKTVDEKFDEFIEHGMQFDGAEKILDQVLGNPRAKNRQATYSRSLSSTHLGIFKNEPIISAASPARSKRRASFKF